jgi:membrane-bound lytic murein transglycosylase D
MLPTDICHRVTFYIFSASASEKTTFSGIVVATLHPFILFCSLILLLMQVTPVSAATHFPRYPAIENNIRFWEKIYDQYTTSQAVVHDSDNLEIIYEVIPIFNHRLPGSSKINKPIFEGIKNKYSNILKNLAKNGTPSGIEEKRILALFGKTSSTRLLTAATSIRIQIGQKDRFMEGVIRSGAYIGEIKELFKKKGLPEDLAYLPHVESSFDLQAYSKFGASGIWQFTRSTGTQFLTINYAVDERQDPILSSHAAASFLKDNYSSLQSWPLAITAYNYGPAGMQRAQQAHGDYENIFHHYTQGHFKFASRNFYSEFLAALNVAKKLERSSAIKTQKPIKTSHFKLPAFISASDISAHFKLSTVALKKLNPALRKAVFQETKYIPKGYILNLPPNKQQLIASIPSQKFHSKQKPTQFYRVRNGDTAGKIAEKFGVSLNSLQKINNLDKHAMILVGQNLLIPDKSVSSGNSLQNISQTQKKINKQSQATPIPILANTKKSPPIWKRIQTARSVVLGEMSIREIQQKENLRSGSITILPGESMELLADWLNVKPDIIRRLNSFPAKRSLQPDEPIQIPLNNVSSAAFEEKRFDFHLETEEDFFDVYKIVGVSSYIVKRGDTIWELCQNKFDLPLWLLKKYNTNLNFNALQSSQQLTVPIVKTI